MTDRFWPLKDQTQEVLLDLCSELAPPISRSGASWSCLRARFALALLGRWTSSKRTETAKTSPSNKQRSGPGRAYGMQPCRQREHWRHDGCFQLIRLYFSHPRFYLLSGCCTEAVSLGEEVRDFCTEQKLCDLTFAGQSPEWGKSSEQLKLDSRRHGEDTAADDGAWHEEGQRAGRQSCLLHMR